MKMHMTLAATLCTLAWAGSALADDRGPSRDEPGSGLEVTMRIIEDPEAIDADAISRRITLPVARAPSDDTETLQQGAPVVSEGPVEGREVSEAARELGREFGEEVSERARDRAEEAREEARERREDFSRSRAEERRPELPEKPEIDPPVPPQP